MDHAVVTGNTGEPTEEEAKQPSSRYHHESYRTLLRSMTEFHHLGPTATATTTTPKRQTPLVNVGYAVRVACVLRHVESFVSFHQQQCSSSNNKGITMIQIVVLGAGMDVTGLWSLSLLNNNNNSSDVDQPTKSALRMCVLEVDFPSICYAKKHAIQQLNLLQEREETSSTNEHPRIVWRGIREANSSCMYTLASADLQDPSAVEEIFTNLLEPDVPTLVLSELVLAYLRPESCDNLLRLCASRLGQGSCLLLYEPLGPALPSREEQEEEKSPVSVLEAYKRSYCSKFNSKLHLGVASNTPEKRKDDNDVAGCSERFFPLASCCAAAEERLLGLCFQYAHAATAGSVAASLRLDWKARELFDEHAALALHLNSYAVVCAFPGGSSVAESSSCAAKPKQLLPKSFDPLLFRRFMCGYWTTENGLVHSPHPVRLRPRDGCKGEDDDDDDCIWIARIEREDEQQVRNLFSTAYRHLFEQYPSVRKMVKSALRQDLGVGDLVGSTVNPNGDASAIGKKYRELGGDFFVAVQIKSQGNFSTIGEDQVLDNPRENDKQQRQYPRRRVLGGIGIRKCTTKERGARDSMPSDAAVYEIHRFFVDEEFRGRGVGAALLNAALDELVQSRRLFLRGNNQSRPMLVVATTPTVLEHANHFYPAKGFDIQVQVQTGDLMMQTYIKTLSPVKRADNLAGRLSG